MSKGTALADTYLPVNYIETERPLLGNSELARLMRAFDWDSTSIGAPETWPKSLRTAVGIMLTSRQPIWIGWGPELTYLYNDPYKSIIGGKHPWALGKPASVVWREIWQEIGPMLSQAMGGDEGTYVEAQLLIMERNGYPEETYYTFSYSPIPADDGTVGGIFCANTDDTQRVIGERQLALLRELAATTSEARTWGQACERSARALSTNPRDLPFALIYMLEPDGRTATLASTSGVERDHPAVTATLSLDEDEPWPLADVARGHQPQVVSDLEMLFQATFPSGAWQQAPDRAVVLPIMPSGKTGRAGFLIAGLNPFRLFDDNYSGFMSLIAGQIGAAITNAEAYETERRRAEALAEINRAKTAFFSNVSHEFRTPLTLMLGPLEDALRHPEELPGERLEEVTVAHRNALRLLRLVNTLLDFSRAEAGRVQVYFEKTDLPALTRDLASNFASICERAGLVLNIACDPLPHPVYVDRDMWEKIVLNLLSNAFKFTFAGGIDVQLRDVGDRVELSVRDTGVGMPSSELPHVFERFHRVEGQHGRTHEGSGIGLALVRELVNLLGGEVRVDSAVGRGTTFRVIVPYGEAHAPAATGNTSRLAPTATKAAAFVEEALRWLPQTSEANLAAIESSRDAAIGTSATAAPFAARERVLVADDNADMRNYVRQLLTPRYEVETVGNGIEALEAIRRTRPDLLVSDVMMPARDGFGLLREIRTDPELGSLPVILLSARAGDEAKVEGLNAGADDYLTKPFSAQELLARVNTNITMARLRREIADEVALQKARLQAVLDTVPVAVWFTFDDQGLNVLGNRRAAEMLRLPETANVSLSVSPAQAPQNFRVFKDGAELPPDRLPLRRAVLGETVMNEEMELHFTDGTVLFGLVQAAPLRDPTGKIVGAVSAGLDITDRKRTEDHRLLLLNELNHRVKNTLATVQSVAMQSFRRAKTEASGRQMFESRLMALSRAHDVLTNESWEGANLDEIVAQAITPYRGGDLNRFHTDGPPVRLPAKMALSISMALHELATNAVKYGALSSEKGRVSITWQTRREADGWWLRLEWLEADGPPVAEPEHEGFGTRLIARGLAQELGGETKIEYRPTGVWCEMNAHLNG
jgi:signal transduction histidine kinase/FixJ family two-component response regulator